jgi:hypothetical protein
LDQCGECAGDDRCVDCRGVPFGDATAEDCTTLQTSPTGPGEDAFISGLSGHGNVAAGGDASRAGDLRGLLDIFAVCLAGALLSLAMMCILKPKWWPSRAWTSAMQCKACKRWCTPLCTCFLWLPRLCQRRRARTSSKVSATTRRQAYAYGLEDSSSDEDAGGCAIKAPGETRGEGSRIIAKAGRAKRKDWRTHTPELQPSSGLPAGLDPISREMLERIDWIAAKATLREV